LITGKQKLILWSSDLGFKKNVNRATTQVMMKTGSFTPCPARLNRADSEGHTLRLKSPETTTVELGD
jgi:hypothetical protein